MYSREAPGAGLATVAIVGLVLNLLAAAAAIVVDLGHVALQSRAQAGHVVGEDALLAVQALIALVAIGQFLLMLGTAAFFIAWLYRFRQNLDELGVRGLETSPGWAIGGWFVPFANLYFPYKVVYDVWTGSDPASRRFGLAASGSAPLVGWWWASYLAMNFLSWPSASLMPDEIAAPAEWIGYSWWSIAASVATVAAAVLAILVVRGLSARQREVYAHLPPPPPVYYAQPGLVAQ